MHDDVILREEGDILENFSPHEIPFAKIIKDRIVKPTTLMLAVVYQSILYSSWILDADIAESFTVKNFLALEEIILLLIFKSVEEDVLKIWTAHLQHHLLEAS